MPCEVISSVYRIFAVLAPQALDGPFSANIVAPVLCCVPADFSDTGSSENVGQDIRNEF